MDCFRREKNVFTLKDYSYDDSGSLSKNVVDDDDDEEEKEEDDFVVPKEEYVLNEEIRQLLYSPDESEEDIVNLLENPNPKIFSVNSSQFEGGNTLLHEAAIAGNSKILQKLLNLGAEIDIKNQDGDTPLISIIKKCKDCSRNGENEKDNNDNDKETDSEEETDESDGPSSNTRKKRECEKHFNCLEILLQKKANHSIKNNVGLSALSFACMCYNEKREEYLKKLLTVNEKGDFSSKLYQALQAKVDSEFLKELSRLNLTVENSKLNEFMFGDYTLLQIACKYGMSESAKRLIELGVDINFAPQHHQRPVQLCCIFARPNILQVMLDKGAHKLNGNFIKSKHGRNLIHLTVKHIPDSKKAYECLKILLKRKYEININEPDEYKRTPLHYAVIRDNDDCVVELLENGALIDKDDLWKQTPLMNISESAMKKYLDKMVTDGKEEKAKKGKKKQSNGKEKQKKEKRKKEDDKGKKDKDEKRKLIFNFDTLFRTVRPEDQKELFFSFPTDLLCKIKNIKRLRKLIEHPIFSIIIYFKWINIRLIFYLYLFLYFLFCILFTSYIYLSEDRPEKKLTPKNLLLRALLRDSKTLSIVTSMRMMTNSNFDVKVYFIVPITFLILVFLFLETLKFFHNKSKYFRDLDNVVRLSNIILAVWVMICLNSRSYFSYCSELKAFSVLMSWFELFLVIGKHPQFSFYVTIFRSASVNLLKFISVHIVLLIGFALCFHILFRTGDSNNTFTNPLNAFFKTIVMLTSEFDASDINFTKYEGFSHIIFIAYIFLATIVLLNLMIGIAFKEVEQMEKNPFLYKSLAQINYIKHFEENFSKNIIIRSIYELLLRFTCWQWENKSKKKTENDGSAGGTKAKFEVTVTLDKRQKIFNNELVFRTYPEEKVDIKVHNHSISKTDDTSSNRLSTSSIRFGGNALFQAANYIYSFFHYHINDIVIENAQKIVSKRFSKNEELKEEKSSVKALENIRMELNELKKLIQDSIGGNQNN